MRFDLFVVVYCTSTNAKVFAVTGSCVAAQINHLTNTDCSSLHLNMSSPFQAFPLLFNFSICVQSI